MTTQNYILPNDPGGADFFCIDAHTCGNPVRLVVNGGPMLEGKNMSEKRIHFMKSYDWIRKGLMFEPRGHDMMSGSILYPPCDSANDAAVLFIETSGCLPMCGHGTIGTITIAIEEGLIHPNVPGMVRLETPAGLVLVEYSMQDVPDAHPSNAYSSNAYSSNAHPSTTLRIGAENADPSTALRALRKVKTVKLTNVPSFLAAENIEVECPELGILTVDIAYGGNFYAIVDSQKNFPGLEYYQADQLISWSRTMREQINLRHDFFHPDDPAIKGCSHILWTGSVLDKNSTARNAVFYGDKAIDRSPCGTGTSARMAQWHAKGKLKKGDIFVHESIIGSKFTGKVEDTTMVAGLPAIIPSIEGWAKVYGRNTININPNDDPYAYGFQVL